MEVWWSSSSWAPKFSDAEEYNEAEEQVERGRPLESTSVASCEGAGNWKELALCRTRFVGSCPTTLGDDEARGLSTTTDGISSITTAGCRYGEGEGVIEVWTGEVVLISPPGIWRTESWAGEVEGVHPSAGVTDAKGEDTVLNTLPGTDVGEGEDDIEAPSWLGDTGGASCPVCIDVTNEHIGEDPVEVDGAGDPSTEDVGVVNSEGLRKTSREGVSPAKVLVAPPVNNGEIFCPP